MTDLGDYKRWTEPYQRRQAKKLREAESKIRIQQEEIGELRDEVFRVRTEASVKGGELLLELRAEKAEVRRLREGAESLTVELRDPRGIVNPAWIWRKLRDLFDSRSENQGEEKVEG